MSSVSDPATFDRFIAVDGSAASRPTRGADSIWLASGRRASGQVDVVENLPTRHELLERLAELAAAGDRTLIAVDWSLGFPEGTSRAFGLDGDPPWRAMWSHLREVVVDEPTNRNNRFAVAEALNQRMGQPGPFWGAPKSMATAALTSRKPGGARLSEWRGVERRLRSNGLRPFSCWQLGGAGAVGGQTLVGIALLARLRERLELERRFAVWPFETGLAMPAADVDVVLVEMWPTLFVAAADLPPDRVRDAAQVEAVVEALIDAAAGDDWPGWWSPGFGADDAERDHVVSEEGWVLGVR